MACKGKKCFDDIRIPKSFGDGKTKRFGLNGNNKASTEETISLTEWLEANGYCTDCGSESSSSDSGSEPTYKVYTALLTQTGTDAPVATVLENTLGGTVVWTRDNVGLYTGTLTGAFQSNKTVLFIGAADDGDYATIAKFAQIRRMSNNAVRVISAAFGNSEEDGILNQTSIEIRVYN